MANFQLFEGMIAQLMATDNNLRGQAEAAFQDTKKTNPELAVSGLIHLLRNSQQEEVRAMCTVLLRRCIGKSGESLWPNISFQTQGVVRETLLSTIEAEKSSHIRNKISDCIATLASHLYETGQWPELLPFMFKCTKSQLEFHRETALQIFSDIAPDIGEQLRPHFNVLKDVLATGLNDSSLKVRVAALCATANFLAVLSEPNERAHFQQFIPLMLGVVSTSLNANQEEEARTAIELFVELAEGDPTFLRPHSSTVINAMITIASATGLEDSTKQLALEFLVTLAEAKPGLCRKHPKFEETLIPIVINMMLDLEDDANWNTGDNDEVDISNSDIGEECLDRLSLGLGGKGIVPIVFGIIPSLMGENSWKHRHTALMAISIMGEGCNKYLFTNLEPIVKTLIPFFRDPHPRVRWAACNAAGQMSTDFGPVFQAMFHSSILPALIGVMDDKDNPRVQSHAAAAVINFCEHSDGELLAPYLNELLAKLYGLLQGGKIIVQEQAVTAIAAVADAASTEFLKYYDTFLPLLKSILANANSKEYRVLRGKTMECISLIGVAVGKEKFYQDAKEICDLMLKTQSTQLEPDDPQISFLLQSWARICKSLGSDFVPYLSAVMPPVLASAKLSPDITISDADNGEDLEGYEFIPIGDKRIGIKTSLLEEKYTACNMLYCYANELKEGFFPYVEEVSKLMVPLMKFYYHDGVRSAAITTMPLLLNSAHLYMVRSGAASGADRTYVRNLFFYMFNPMIEAITEEMDMETLVFAVEALADSINVAGENCLSQEQLKKVSTLLSSLLQEVHQRRAERAAQRAEEDHDEEEEERIEEAAEKDDEVIGQVADVIGACSRNYKANWLPFFNELLPFVLEMLKTNKQASDRQAALCILDDVVEHCGQATAPLFQHFLPTSIQYISDPDPSVRQAAVYGMGVFSQAGGEVIAQAIPGILSRLSQIIVAPDSRSENYITPTENAIAAVGKICQFHSTAIDTAAVLPTWLSWLPVLEDKVESKVTYAQLCTFVEGNNPHILGQGFTNLPKILSIFAVILESELIDETISQRVVNILKQMRTGIPGDVVQRAFSSLPPEQQQKLSKYSS